MKKLLLASLVLIFTCIYAYGDTEVVGLPGGGGVSEGDDVGFGIITSTSIQVGEGSAATPSLAVGRVNQGFYSMGVNQVGVSTNGALRWTFIGNAFYSDVTTGTRLESAAGTNTIPNIMPARSDANTGIGRAGDDQLSLIAGGVEGARIYKNGVDLKVGVAFSGISSITSDYAIGNFDADPTWFIPCDATLGNISTTLPPVADKLGRLIEMKLTSATNGCYFDGNGAETIDGATGQAITTQYNIISLIAGATEWLIR